MQNAKDMGFKFARMFQNKEGAAKTSLAKKCYLNPDHSFKRTWDTFMALVILWSTIITPIRVSIFYSETVIVLDIIGKFVDTFFVVDFIFNFFTAYYDKDNLITSKKAIAKKYIKSSMILDLITAVPLNIFLPTGKDDKTYLPIFKFMIEYPRFLQFIRLTKYPFYRPNL